jgi:Fic family protein
MERSKKTYDTALEQASGYGVNVTSWIAYFTETVLAAQQYSEKSIRFVLAKAKYFTNHTAPLNDRQQKALSRMFEAGPTGFAGGISAGKYASLTKTSKPTASPALVSMAVGVKPVEAL